MEIITFANLANVHRLIEMEEVHLFDKVYSDGMFLAWIINIFSNKGVERMSFDFTSLAREVVLGPSSYRIIFCGGSREEILNARRNLNAVDKEDWLFLDGYGGVRDLVDRVRDFQPDVVILSLGSGLQEKCALELRQVFRDLPMKVYTAGAFISQTSIRPFYYPAYVDFLGLRWAYRAFNSAHVRRRLFTVYPRNIIKLIFNSQFRSKVIGIVS